MPVYEYGCDVCGKRFEVRQSMHDAAVSACPECGGVTRRIYSGGGGFLIKDANSATQVRPHCGKTYTCCGSCTPCATASCEKG